jgi:hypothetical protein
MHKNYFLSLCAITLGGCGVQNNLSFTTQTGNCYDGTTNAPYCVGVTLQNNSGGQNFITSTNFPITGLSLSLTGASNVGYPSSAGSNYDPNNCLGSGIAPGQSCTFYLQLTGESVPVGQAQAITLTANYTINSDLFGGSGSNGSTSLALTQTSNLLLSNTTGWVEPYSINGLAAAYHGESENINNATINDNYYGLLYMAGNSGIYISGNGNYITNATNQSNSIKGASNLLINGQALYGVPTGALSNSVYNASIVTESFNWQQFATGIPSVATNVSAINGNKIFIAQSVIAAVEVCSIFAGSSNCIPEGVTIPGASSITALGFSYLGNLNGSSTTGVVAGANNGLWIESGIIGSSNNGWVQAVYSGTMDPITNSIVKIVADSGLNLYIADAAGHIYYLPINGGNSVTQKTNWSAVQGQTITAMVYDNSGSTLYVATQSGNVFACGNLIGGSCNLLLQNVFTNNLSGLNIVSSLN